MIKFLRWITKWTFILCSAYVAFMLSIEYFFPEFYEGWQEENQEREQKQAELKKQQELERPYVELSEKLDGLSNFDDLTFLSCPPLEVFFAAKCGISQELAKTGQRHCGSGYTKGQTLDRYYLAFGRNSGDQMYQQHVAAKLNPVTGYLASYVEETRDYKSSPENKTLSTYWLEVGSDTFELDRESLRLTNKSHRVIRESARKYGIEQFFPLEIAYSFGARSTCEIVDMTASRFEETIVNQAKSLKRQYELSKAKRIADEAEEQSRKEAEASERNKL